MHQISNPPCPCVLLNLIPFWYKKIHNKPGKINDWRYSGMLVNTLVVLFTMCGLTLSWVIFVFYSWVRHLLPHCLSLTRIPSLWNHYWQTIFYGDVVDPLWLWVTMLMSSVNSSLVNKGLCSWIHVVSLIYLFSSGPCRVGVQSYHDEGCICQMVILLLLLSIQWQFVSLVDIQLNLSLWITWF